MVSFCVDWRIALLSFFYAMVAISRPYRKVDLIYLDFFSLMSDILLLFLEFSKYHDDTIILNLYFGSNKLLNSCYPNGIIIR